MLDPKQISIIVHNTLVDIGVNEPAIERLIKGTFLAESGLSLLFDHSNVYNKKRGLMLMDDSVAIELLEEELRFKPVQRDAISTACLINLDKTTIGARLNALDYNIAFMISMTYVFYSSKYDVIPPDDLHDIASYYFKYYRKTGNGNMDKFIETYKSTFLNK